MAYTQKGMSFGDGTGYRSPQSSNLKAEFNKEPNEAGYITKTKSGKNLFGRKRNVTKYYDPVTGKKVGKKVDVAIGKGDPRPNKVKLKKVNPGLTQSGGVGKIRLDENPWEKPTGKTDGQPPNTPPPPNTDGEETNINRAQYAVETDDKNKQYDKDGNPILNTYAKEYAKFEDVDGKKKNPRTGKLYSDLSEFENEAEEWWAKQAKLTKNEKLKKQNQEYGVDEEGNVKYKK